MLADYAPLAQQRWLAWLKKQRIESRVPAEFSIVLDLASQRLPSDLSRTLDLAVSMGLSVAPVL
jgi:hypothetical protein